MINPNLDFESQDSDWGPSDCCRNFNTSCELMIPPVVGIAFGLYIPYVIAVALALIGSGIFIITIGHGEVC